MAHVDTETRQRTIRSVADIKDEGMGSVTRAGVEEFAQVTE